MPPQVTSLKLFTLSLLCVRVACAKVAPAPHPKGCNELARRSPQPVHTCYNGVLRKFHVAGLQTCLLGKGCNSMFERQTGVTTSIPQWSGEFEVVGPDTGLMRVSNYDTRQHFPPAGWEATGHSTFDDGTFEVFTYRRPL